MIIGENKLSKEDFDKICDFVRKNLDILLKHFDPDNEFEDEDLWDALEGNGSIKRSQN